jgi:segregation and condensation protein A
LSGDPMEYQVRLEKFEGPLDLLLYLIRKQEINIYDIPIARITEQYLEYIRMMEFLNLELAGEFLVMAATLMRIKARMLLPAREDEEDENIDPREQLVQQLLEYQRFKEAAGQLETMLYQRELLFARPEPDGGPGPADVEYEYNLFDLIASFRQVLERARVRYVEVKAEEVSIEDKIEVLKDRLAGQEVIAFEDLFSEDTRPVDFITTFLALLEILRLRLARVQQARPFGQIWIHRVTKETPDGGS